LNMLLKYTHCQYTDWNMKYLSIAICIYSCYEVVISLAGSRAMIRKSLGQVSA